MVDIPAGAASTNQTPICGFGVSVRNYDYFKIPAGAVKSNQTPIASFGVAVRNYDYFKIPAGAVKSSQTPVAVLAAVLRNYDPFKIPAGAVSTNQTPSAKFTVTDGFPFNIEIGQYVNGSFSKITSGQLKVPINPKDVATVAVITEDNGGNVKVTVRFFDRKTGNKWETSFTVNKLVNVGGGIGLYTEDQSEIDNVTIMYNKESS